jgi:O-antigen/teichoic acid export membrane protein
MKLPAVVDVRGTPDSLIVAGRAIGMAASFAIGIALVRIFDPAAFGLYKQFFLIYATLFGIAQLGMAESLYYFVPRNREVTGRYVANAVSTLAVNGLLCLALVYLGRGFIAGQVVDEQLWRYAHLIGLFLTLTLMSTVFEIVLISRKQHLRAAGAYALSDIARTLFVVTPALVTRDIGAVFVGATTFALFRLLVMLGLFWREFGRDLRPDLVLWRRQLAYALPFTAAVTVEIVQINFHQYVVASKVDPATFAIYAIGCLQIPLVDLIATSSVNVLMVKMAETGHDRRAAVAAWHRTVSRLAYLLVPLTVVLIVLANQLIVGLFTTRYQASVPIFQVWALTVLPPMLAVDGVLRVYARTRLLLAMNALRLACVVLLIGSFFATFGLVGAVMVTLMSTVLVKAIGVVGIARHLHLSLREALPWRQLALISTRAFAAAIPVVWLTHSVPMPPLVGLAAGMVTYAMTYVALGLRPAPTAVGTAPLQIEDADPVRLKSL